MKIEQIYTGCLSQGSYYIESNGEVAIIDPLREISNYLKLANENNAKIKYVFETHIHADFVSGHLTLSKATGAPIIFGPNAKTSYPITVAKDFQEFKLGDLSLIVLHTPGHTLESTTYLLVRRNNEIFNILKYKRDEIILKLELPTKEEFDILKKRVENLERSKPAKIKKKTKKLKR